MSTRLFWLTVRYLSAFTAGAVVATWMLFSQAGPLSQSLLTAGVRLSAASHEPTWSLMVADDIPSKAMPVKVKR